MNRFDVVVVGGGPAGIGAAVAAARLGKRTALIERHPFLGGMGTAALVSNFCNAHWDGERFLIGGIFAELRRRLINRDALFVTGGLEPYEPKALAEETSQLCEEAGIGAVLGRSVKSINFDDNGSPARFKLDDGMEGEAKMVIDASGDATIAAGAGVPFTQGRAADGAVMPLTYCYLLGPIDLETLQREMPECIMRDRRTGAPFIYMGGQERITQSLHEAKRLGEVTIPRDRIAVAFSVPGQPENIVVNFGRVFIQDPTDPQQMAAAEIEGKKQIAEGAQFFKKYLPGFENAGVVEIARQIGVRESRQIAGLYTLTAEDILAARQFDDVIAQCCYSIDIHQPDNSGTVMKSLPRGTHYDIPWRCLVPREGPPNLIVAGRSISATQEAMSSFRVTPSVMAIGEAAGVTAALAIRGGTRIVDVEPKRVQEHLLATGGILS